jgi:rhodanese-related sulfurtransferase
MTRTTATLSAIMFTLVLILAGAACADEKVQTITAEELLKRLTDGRARPLIVDVREPEEFAAAHIAGAMLVPLATTEHALTDVAKNQEIVLVCRSGRRSAKAYGILASRGFTTLRNMEGGMVSWEKLGYPVVKK